MKRRQFFTLGAAGIGSIALTKQAQALEYYPAASDKKWAVLYSTWCGSSRDAAVWISEGMGGGIADVYDVREQPDLKGFDHIVAGGSIRGNATSEELQGFLKKNSGWMKGKIRAFFAVCGNMGQPVGPEQTTDFIDNHLAILCDVTEIPSRIFLGRITKSLMDSETAKMMEWAEDYDHLKRSECMAFGREILTRLAP